ncbi:hypothetical protein QP810_10005 [Streptococcus agalactiae]|uniref:hypothetical protein n=1 Tax=Streptococcus agalactiae TaxID=1311 RepID=UPI002553AAF3|nr:hypothetical protein [Streptococcus agalactiae]MDK8747557.1 hypothetical protein [Streptococcus agalactiae]
MKVSLDVLQKYVEQKHFREYRLLMGPNEFSNEKFFLRIPNYKGRVYSNSDNIQYIEFQVKKHNLSLELIDTLLSSQVHMILCLLSSFQYILIICKFSCLRNVGDSYEIEFEIYDAFEKSYSNAFNLI